MSITAEQFEALMPDGTQVESEYIEMESTLHYLQLALLVGLKQKSSPNQA